MKLIDAIQAAVYENALKLSGISHLLQNYSSADSRERDNEDIQGLGVLIESLSNEGRRIGELIDMAHSVSMDAEVIVSGPDHNVLVSAESTVWALRGKMGSSA